MMFWHDSMVGWGFAFMTLGGILLFTLVIVGIVVLVRAMTGADSWTGGTLADRPAPEQVLADRFARGEIDAGEYRHMLVVLRDQAADPVRRDEDGPLVTRHRDV
jgi:putative membrane protein